MFTLTKDRDEVILITQVRGCLWGSYFQGNNRRPGVGQRETLWKHSETKPAFKM